MPRPRSVPETEVLESLAAVFAANGYEGASLGQLAAAAGLGKATLYHRFPEGKNQMAVEVLDRVGCIFAETVIAPLVADGPIEQRLDKAVAAISGFYEGGRRSCLLNMLAVPAQAGTPLGQAVAGMIGALLDAFASLARDAGVDADEARRRAMRALTLLQGGLVLARGLNSLEPFSQALADLRRELAGHQPQGGRQ